MKKQNIIILSFAMVLFLAGCSNVEAKQGNNTSIESKTTITTTEASNTTSLVVTPSEMSSTSASESIPIISDEITTTTTENKTTTSTLIEKVESSTALETTTTAGTTTTKKPTTVTTTTKATTTKKPATVTTTNRATTTTKKATTTTRKVTTTTKKTTTTATTTKKTTTTTSKADTLTQADIDKLVAELQENSNSKAVGYKQYFPEGGRISFDEAVADNIATKTPQNSSWDPPDRFAGKYMNYEWMYERVKMSIDDNYLSTPNAHIVIYAEYHPNGYIYDGVQYSTSECYVFYCLR